MRQTVSIVIVFCAAAAVTMPVAAQKRPAPAAAPAPCTCPEAAEPAALLREGGLAECTDGIDNDRDGHLDCTDQDCEIYAVCAVRPVAALEPPMPPATAKTYATMRELKQDLRAGAISGHDFYNWQMMIRAWRSAEIDTAKADLRAGRITHAEFKARLAAIRLKYEG
jgi:hypothetical protein